MRVATATKRTEPRGVAHVLPILAREHGIARYIVRRHLIVLLLVLLKCLTRPQVRIHSLNCRGLGIAANHGRRLPYHLLLHFDVVSGIGSCDDASRP